MPILRGAAALPLVVVVFCLVAACGGHGRRTYTFGESGAPSTVASSPIFLAVPRGSALQAERIAERNGLVTRLVRLGGGQRSVRASRWNDLDGRPLGAALTYTLRRQIVMNSNLPYVAIPPDAPARGDCVKPYAAGWHHLEASGVTALKVLVDLRRGQVVDISTNARQGIISPVAGKPYPACQEIPAGG